jgi:transcriptional regulator with GAF, ATPase, and Fis domain
MDNQYRDWVSRDIACALGSDLNVLITGSDRRRRLTLARRIHDASTARRANPLIQIPLAKDWTSAISQLVLDSPHGSTLLIEEVATLRLSSRAELARLLDRAEARVIATTGHNLLSRIASRSFDRDLFYRLNTIHLVLSPHLLISAWCIAGDLRRPGEAGFAMNPVAADEHDREATQRTLADVVASTLTIDAVTCTGVQSGTDPDQTVLLRW